MMGLLRNAESSKKKKISEKLTNKEIIKNLDDAFEIYILGYWNFYTLEENKLSLKIAFLFREFLNFRGWDQIPIIEKYLFGNEKLEGKELTEACDMTLCYCFPDMIDDFLAVFLKEDAFENEFEEIKLFITQFCDFLFLEDLMD